MLVYSFQVYEWPASLLKKLEVWSRNFLWSGSIDRRGVPLIAWKTCCSPLDEGGLGLKCLTLLNRSFLLKKCWEVYSSSSNGCKFLHVRFIRNGMPRSSYAISSIWLGLKKFWPQVLLHGTWLIGSGS